MFYINLFLNKQDFIAKEIGEFNLIEHFGVFFRFKLNVNTPVAQIFGLFEDNVILLYLNFFKKKKLLIQHYSIKQATIEQIFNMFAKG